MAITKRKIDLFIKSNPIVDDYYHQSDYYDYYGSDYYDDQYRSISSYEDDDYRYVSDYNTISNLLLSTNLLYRKGLLDTRFSVSGYKIIDMDSIYDTSKIRDRKIDKVLGILDDTKFSNRLGNYLNTIKNETK